jgi:sulfite reductase alpha subunit-like flavoprotein
MFYGVRNNKDDFIYSHDLTWIFKENLKFYCQNAELYVGCSREYIEENGS